jgi:hypothetical protein
LVSILNINDLPELYDYVTELKLPHIWNLLSNPEYMNIQKYNKEFVIVGSDEFKKRGLEVYYDLVGTMLDNSAAIKLHQYIEQFNSIRKPLALFDPILARNLLQKNDG